MEKKYDPNKRHIIISGGSKGLGYSLCQSLLEDKNYPGYFISTFSRTKTAEMDELLQRYPDSFYYAELDIHDGKALIDYVEEACKRSSNLYGLINNAAIVQAGVLATLPEVEIMKMLEVNVTSALMLTRLFLRKMLQEEGKGRIVNISSICGLRGYSGLAVYSATKAALDGFTRGLARELGSRGITVNSVAPGYMRTDLSASLSDEQLEQIKRRTPLGRLAEGIDIVPLVRFLLSEEASFITSQTIVVDGGISN